ncbi:MAG: 7TM diverse intracellular signaling domain-containing protein [Cyclobacteriaceae bacterium]
MRKLFIVFPALFLLHFTAPGSQYETGEVILTSQDSFTSLTRLQNSQVGVLVDSTRKMEIGEIVSSFHFESIELSEFSPENNYWFKVVLQNHSTSDLTVLLFSNEWKNSFWEFSDNGFIDHGTKGVLISKVHDNFYTGQNNQCKLKVKLVPNSAKTIYIKVDGSIGDLPFKIDTGISIQQLKSFEEEASKDLMAISIFIGMVVVIILTNMVLGLVFNETSSTYYLFFVICMSLFQAGYYKFFWFVSPDINFDFSLLFSVIWLFYVLFASSYLDFKKKSPQGWKFSLALICFTGISTIGLIILYFNSTEYYYHVLPRLNTVFAIISMPFIYYVAIQPGKLKYFVLVALGFGIVGSVITTFSLHFAFLTSSYVYSLAGSGLEICCFLVGLAYKMNLNKQEAERAVFEAREREKEKEHLLEIKQLQEEKFETEMKLKTNELTSLSMGVAAKTEVLDKVYHYIKNNDNGMGRELLSEIKDKLRIDEDWKTFKIRFEKVNPTFFDELLKVAPDLTENDLRFASLLYVQLNTHEICQLLNLSQRTVQTAKYRLKKKLNLSKEVDLMSYVCDLT